MFLFVTQKSCFQETKGYMKRKKEQLERVQRRKHKCWLAADMNANEDDFIIG